MKKLATSFLLVVTLFSFSGCSTLRSVFLSESDASSALREALIFGVNNGSSVLGRKGAFGKDLILSAILPQDLQRVVKTLDNLGFTPQLNRFTTTLENATVETVTKSTPIFLSGVRQLSFRDAVALVKNGGTAGTNYLRETIGDTLHRAVTPIMRNMLDQYKIAQEWDKLVSPAKLLLGNKVQLNLGLDNIMALLVVNQMFKKIEEQEIAVRTNAQARTTPLLQRVFGRDWNTVR